MPTIRVAETTDLPTIIELMREFAAFEKLSAGFCATEADLASVLFGADAFAGCLVVEAEQRVVGYAVFFPVFRTFRGEKSLYLEDIYLTPLFQGRGLGYRLMRAVAAEAKRRGCVRMDWQALTWNVPAFKFYDRLRAETDAGNTDFRLRGTAFEALTATAASKTVE